MKIKYHSLLSMLVPLVLISLVFEETVYGWLHLSGASYLVGKVWTELTLYGALALVLTNKMVNGTLLKYKVDYFDLCLFAFIVFGVVSILSNGGSLFLGVLNIRTMLRYVAVYYIVILTFEHDAAANIPKFPKFLKLIVMIAVMQSILSVIQHFSGDVFIERYFSAPTLSGINTDAIQVTMSDGGRKPGAAIGTFGKSAIMALFLMLAAVIASVRAISDGGKVRLMWWIIYAVILVGVLFTYKRSALLLTLFAPFAASWFAGYKYIVTRYMLAGAVGFVIVLAYMFASVGNIEYMKSKEAEISPVNSLLQLTTSEYWAIAANKSRGWVLTDVGGQVLMSFKPLGYGADVENAQAELAKLGGEFGKLIGWGSLDDVYMVAILVYFGPIGLLLIMFCFKSIYDRARVLSRSPIKEVRVLGLVVCVLLILTLFSSFVVRTLEFRSFSFCLFLLSGLVVAIYRERIHERNLISKNESVRDA